MKLRLNNMAYYLLSSFMYNSRITIMSYFLFGKKVNIQLNQNQIKTPLSRSFTKVSILSYDPHPISRKVMKYDRHTG
jgi:hypothetical protein